MKTRDFLGNEWEIDCMGCAIVSDTMLVPGGVIKQTKNFRVHQDPLIPIIGFLVIASVRHVRSISEMTEAEYEELATLIRSTHQAIKEVTKIENLTVVQEERSRHFHLWFFPWTQGVTDQYGEPSLTKIREIMENYQKETIGEKEWEELNKTISEIKTHML